VSVLPAAGAISFARGIPSPDLLPVEQLAEASRRAIERHGRVALNYGSPAGFGPLREWIAARHRVATDQVVVTPGSLIGLGFLLRHLLAGGGRALVESPTYDRTLQLLRAVDAEAVTAPPARLAYVMPTFHNPTGRTMTLPEREELADRVVEHELTVIEDDPYGLLRFEGEPPPHLHGLLHDRGAGELAVLMSSFSKSVAPGLRVGYLVLPAALVAPIEALAASTYVSPPLLAQAQLYEFLAAGHLEPHLADVRAALRPRRDALLAVLDAELGAHATWTRPDGGYFLWLELAEGSAAQLAERAAAAGVPFVPGTGFFAGPGGERSARLSYCYPSVDEIHVGAQRLAALIRQPG
jgi:2-aminoadipate transaminase